MMAGSKPPEALGAYTGFLFTWIAERGRARFAQEMARFDLRPPHFAALVVIDAHPGATQQELVGAIEIDPSTMVQIIDALEAAGLAERRMHASDRRKRAVHLTAAGEERLRDARAAAQDAADDLFGALDAAERRELHGMLRRLAGLEEQAKSPADRAPH
jgi:DNA-binding MarR family transcriptional regulator